MAVAGDFWRLWSASAVSSLGDGLRVAALPLLAARLTHDPQRVTLVAAAEGAAWLLFGLPAGALADRWERRRTMVACDGVRTVLVVVLAVAAGLGWASIPLLMVVGFGLNAAETLFYGAAQAAIPAVVPKPELERANGRLYAVEMFGAGFAGPFLGAVLFVVAPTAPFAVDAATFAIAALVVWRIRTALTAAREEQQHRHLLGQVTDGLVWLVRHRTLRTILILLTVWNLVESAALAVLVLWVLGRLGLPETGYGIMIAALAAGGVIGALIADRVGQRLGTGTAMSCVVVVTVAGYAGLGVTTSPWTAGVLMALVGLAAFIWNVLSAALRQALVPEAMLGRISSAYRFATWGVLTPGALLGGAVASRWGVQAPFLLAAATLTGIAILTLPSLTNQKLSAARLGSRGPGWH